MLLSVEIANFRSCVNVHVNDVSNVLVLVGRNGVGKTNILCAIEWAAQTAVMSKPLEYSIFEDTPPGDVTLRFKLDGRIFRYSIKCEDLTLQVRDPKEARINRVERLVEELSSGREDVVFQLDSGRLVISEVILKIGAGSPAMSSIFSLVPDSPVLPLLRHVLTFLSSIKYYPLADADSVSIEAGMFISEGELTDWRNGKDVRTASAMQLKLLTLYLDRRDRFDELAHLLGPNGLDVVNNISVVSFPVPIGVDGPAGSEQVNTTYYLVRFSPAKFSSGKLFQFNSLSFGTRRVIRLMTSLIYDATSVFLLEQPEDGIHAGLLHKLLPLLRSYSDETQIIVTTHSSQILNRVQPSEVRLIDMEHEFTTVRALSAEEIVGAQEYMQQDGPLSDFLESVQE